MAERLYYNGSILTMEETTAEAVLVCKDTIKKVGELAEVAKVASADCERIDLKGHTLMPAFIDPHSHFTAYASSYLEVSLEEAVSFEEIIERIQNFIKKNKIEEGKWVIAAKYDENALQEQSHPSVEILDQAAPKNPLVIKHQSGHLGLFNTLALKELGITVDTPVPEGSIIEKRDGKLTGLIEESIYMEYLEKLPMVSMEEIKEAYKKADKAYASYGICTAQEGYMVEQMIPMLKLLIAEKLLHIDLVGYMDFEDEAKFKAEFPTCIKHYENHFKIGGLKTFMDGSPQARTAWMFTPYENSNDAYYGEHVQGKDELYKKVSYAVGEDLQLLCHANGDAAIGAFIDAYNQVCLDYRLKGKIMNQIRPVIIHAQLMTKEEIQRAVRLSMIASFFVAHVYYWGDVHIKNFGLERASCISPAKSAIEAGLVVTFHQDSPVVEPDMLKTVWCAVNRITKAGKVLGRNEQISPYEALKAVTINAAYQYFEEDRKGSIKEGKLADLCILEENPLTVEPDHIKDISVLTTIKAGEIIYQK